MIAIEVDYCRWRIEPSASIRMPHCKSIHDTEWARILKKTGSELVCVRFGIVIVSRQIVTGWLLNSIERDSMGLLQAAAAATSSHSNVRTQAN